jgi:hypothetical protein
MKKTIIILSIVLSLSGIILLFVFLFVYGFERGRDPKLPKEDIQQKDTITTEKKSLKDIDTLQISQIHKPNYIVCDLDGDSIKDSVLLVMNTRNKKYGLKIVFGNGRIDYLGMGNNVLGQDFDDFDWVGEFRKIDKGKICWNNVDTEGLILTDEQILEKDKIKLPNDGIFVHQSEACGGGIIYLKNGKYEWIQRE